MNTKDIDAAIRDWSGIGRDDFASDLNAIHEAEKKLPKDNSLHGYVVYCNHLMQITGSFQECHTATATQRAEALLRTIGKWKESK